MTVYRLPSTSYTGPLPYLLRGSGRGTASPGKSGMRVLPDGGPSPLILLPPQAAKARQLIASSGSLARIRGNPRGDFLAELVSGQRVHDAAVVFRDHKEVVEAHPVLGSVVAFIGKQRCLVVPVKLRRKYDAFLTQRFDRVILFERVPGFGNRTVPPVAQRRLRRHFLIGAPAMFD